MRPFITIGPRHVKQDASGLRPFAPLSLSKDICDESDLIDRADAD